MTKTRTIIDCYDQPRTIYVDACPEHLTRWYGDVCAYPYIVEDHEGREHEAADFWGVTTKGEDIIGDHYDLSPQEAHDLAKYIAETWFGGDEVQIWEDYERVQDDAHQWIIYRRAAP